MCFDHYVIKMMTRHRYLNHREIIAEPGTTLTLEFVAPKLDEQGTVASPSKTAPTDGTKSIETFFIMRYTLSVMDFLERSFGREVLVSILTDGVSNPINEIKIFGFLEHAKLYMAKHPRIVKWMVCLIPVLDFALKVALLYWVQSLFLKVSDAQSGKATTASDRKVEAATEDTTPDMEK
ncbi:hypothetical protein Hanom_Chr11g01047711 [Helianthus anomalus]